MADDLDRPQERLPTVDHQRVLSVFDETIEALEVAIRIPSAWQELNSLAPHLELSETQAITMIGYQIQEVVPDSINVPLSEELQVAVHLLISNKESYRTLLDMTNPSHTSLQMIQLLRELRGFVLQRLMASDLDDKKRDAMLENLQKRERKLAMEVIRLKGEVENAGKADLETIKNLQDVLRQTEDELEKMLTISAEALLKQRVDAKKQTKMDERLAHQRFALLQEELTQLQAQYAKVVHENLESELVLRKRKYKINTEVDNWVTKYDHEMSEKQAQYESIMEEYLREKVELEQKEKEFAVVEAIYKEIALERAEREKKRREMEEYLRILVIAVTKIQALWRGYRTRKQLKKKDKKK